MAHWPTNATKGANALEFGFFLPKSKADWSSGSDSHLCNQKPFSPVLFKDCPLEGSQINLKGSRRLPGM